MKIGTVRRVVNGAFIAIGIVLTAYIVMATLGWIRNSSQHYTNFVLATMAMAGLLMLRNLLDEKSSEHAGRFWLLRLLVAAIATLVVIGGALYLRVQAIHLETVQPFFRRARFSGWARLPYRCPSGDAVSLGMDSNHSDYTGDPVFLFRPPYRQSLSFPSGV